MRREKDMTRKNVQSCRVLALLEQKQTRESRKKTQRRAKTAWIGSKTKQTVDIKTASTNNAEQQRATQQGHSII